MMTRTLVLPALCLTACHLAACAGSIMPMERPAQVGPAARRTTALPTRLTSGGSVDRPVSMLILGLN